MAICNIIRIVEMGSTVEVEHMLTSASAINLLDNFTPHKQLADWFDNMALLSHADNDWIFVTTTG